MSVSVRNVFFGPLHNDNIFEFISELDNQDQLHKPAMSRLGLCLSYQSWMVCILLEIQSNSSCKIAMFNLTNYFMYAVQTR